jgi:cob(I)alamin adenosyltransferase
MKKGCVQIYTGNGKGKTTAALGLALRAAGRGLRVRLVQFMKGRETGELRSLALLPSVTVYRVCESSKFFDNMDKAERRALRAACRAMMERIAGWLAEGKTDVLILDEVLGALKCGAVTLEEILSLLMKRPGGMEIVLTGRAAPQELVDRADLVTEMVPVKHYFDRGVPAREGIEY